MSEEEHESSLCYRCRSRTCWCRSLLGINGRDVPVRKPKLRWWRSSFTYLGLAIVGQFVFILTLAVIWMIAGWFLQENESISQELDSNIGLVKVEKIQEKASRWRVAQSN